LGPPAPRRRAQEDPRGEVARGDRRDPLGSVVPGARRSPPPRRGDGPRDPEHDRFCGSSAGRAGGGGWGNDSGLLAAGTARAIPSTIASAAPRRAAREERRPSAGRGDERDREDALVDADERASSHAHG